MNMRLWEYIEARMPEKSSRTRTVNCKFAVGAARMLIENESRRTFGVNDVNLWLAWVRNRYLMPKIRQFADDLRGMIDNDGRA